MNGIDSIDKNGTINSKWGGIQNEERKKKKMENQMWTSLVDIKLKQLRL